jgi:hypothetical protein
VFLESVRTNEVLNVLSLQQAVDIIIMPHEIDRELPRRPLLAEFRVPDRGSGNPTPLGGWDSGVSHVN